jgi:hypothetical protein
MTVGLLEVARKRAEWRELKRKERERRLAEHWFPSVLGPKRRYYVVDHHHLLLALHREGVRSGWAIVLADYSWLEPDRFWRTMEFHQWAHPFDERGRRHDYARIPKKVTGMRDDPYRSLAGLVRGAGGFAKENTPFAEFLWADYFRLHVPAKLIERFPEEAIAEGVRLARRRDARYLPGWTGRMEQAGR